MKGFPLRLLFSACLLAAPLHSRALLKYCLQLLMGTPQQSLPLSETAVVRLNPEAAPVAYSQYDEHVMNGGLTLVRTTTRLDTKEKVTHRSPLHELNAEEHAQSLQSLEHQASVLAQLNPNQNIAYLPRSYGMITFADGTKVLEMEYIRGEDLKETFSEILSAEEVDWKRKFLFSINSTREMIEILSDVHARGLIHLDVKLENFIREHETGQFKLIDFSGATLKSVGKEPLYAPNLLITPNYAAPEVTAKNYLERTLTKSIDYYALAKSLEERVLPKLDPGPRVGWKRMGIMSKERKDWEKKNTAYLMFKYSLLARLMAKDPRNRPSDPLALIKQIQSDIEKLLKP